MEFPEINISQDPNDYVDWCPVCNELANCADLQNLEAGINTHEEVRHYNQPLHVDGQGWCLKLRLIKLSARQ